MTPSETQDSVSRSRRSLVVFFAVLALLTALMQGLIFRTGEDLSNISALYVLGLMWAPAVASIVARLALREGFGDISLRWGGRPGWRSVAIALTVPLVVGTTAYGIAWLSGLATWDPPTADSMPWLPSAAGRFAVRLLLNGSIGVVIGTVFAAGEELGWRGYMLVRMMDARLPRPVLLGGIAWGFWHVPLIVSGQYTVARSIPLAVPLFCALVVSFAYFFGWLRLRSGSVWPAVFAHAAWNAIIQGVFDRSTAGESIWVGEAGVLVTLASLAVVWWLVRKPLQSLRAPGLAADGEPLNMLRL